MFFGQIRHPDGPFFYLFILCHDNKPPTVLHLTAVYVERLCIVYFLSGHSETMWQPQLGIGSVWVSIPVSIISPCVLVMISYRLSCIALLHFSPLSVFPICLWVEQSTKCEPLFVPSTSRFPSPPPLPLSLRSVKLPWLWCVCVCPLGLKQTLPCAPGGEAHLGSSLMREQWSVLFVCIW